MICRQDDSTTTAVAVAAVMDGQEIARAAIVDELPMLRRGVAAVLGDCGIEVVATASKARDGIRFARQHRADLLVLGALADTWLEQAVADASRLRPRPRIIALLPYEGHHYVPALVRRHTDAMLWRFAHEDMLRSAVRRLGRGERVVSQAVIPALLRSGRAAPHRPESPRPTTADLTSQEERVLSALARGLSNREIAAELFVSMATVKTHLSHVYGKLGVGTRSEALSRAVSLGLLVH